MTTDPDLPPLPSFLNRKTWSTEQWARSEAAWNKALAKEREEATALACKIKEAKEARVQEKKAKEAKAQERREVLKKREERRIEKNTALNAVRWAMDRGHMTANAIGAEVQEKHKKLVPWALRTMLKKGEIAKLSRQTYKRISK